MNYKIALTVIGVSVAVNAFCANQQPQPPQAPKPEPNQWTVGFLSIPLTFANYYALTRVLLPLTLKTNNLFRSEALNPALAFAGLALTERFLSPLLINWLSKKTDLVSKQELKLAQRNAMIASTLFYAAPESLKDRIKSVYPALQRMFFKKTKDGLSVKGFEQVQELVPLIQNFNNGIKGEYAKIILLEEAANKLKSELNNPGLADKARKALEERLNKNFEEYKNVIIEFSNLLIKREDQREKLYENYSVLDLVRLKELAKGIRDESRSLDFIALSNAFNPLKELHTKIRGGFLGIIGEALQYFEGSW